MKRVVYFLSCVILLVAVAVSCKHKNPVDDPSTKPNDSIPANPVDTTNHDTLPDTTVVPVDTVIVPVDSTVVDTLPADTVVVPVDTVVPDSNGYVHQLLLLTFTGTVNVPKSNADDYVCEDVVVDLLKSDTIEGKYKMYLNQVSFDPQMPRMDIVLDGISANADGTLWCDSLVPIGINFFNTGFDLPVPAYEVYRMDGETYYDAVTGEAFYSTSLSIKGIGVTNYIGTTQVEP